MTGNTTEFVREKMSFTEALQYQQIYFGEVNARRQMSFNEVPRLMLLKIGPPAQERI